MGSWDSKGGTGWSTTSLSVKTSPWIELTSEQDPDIEQDLGLVRMGIGGTRFWHFLGGNGGGTGDEDGVDVVADLVGVLVITDPLAWGCLDMEELAPSTRTMLSNLLDRFLLRTESRASPHTWPELLASSRILLHALANSRVSFSSLGEVFPEFSSLVSRLRGLASSLYWLGSRVLVAISEWRRYRKGQILRQEEQTCTCWLLLLFHQLIQL